MATHSSIPAWRIHGQRSLVGTVHGVAKSDTTERLMNTAQPDYEGYLLSHSASQSSRLMTVSPGPRAAPASELGPTLHTPTSPNAGLM